MQTQPAARAARGPVPRGAHRQNFAPVPLPGPARPRRLLLLSAEMLVLALCAGALTLDGFETSPAVAAPARRTEAHAMPLPSLGIADSDVAAQLLEVRAEAFRAGLSEGLRQSCGLPVLSAPIAAR